jgi:hypothetical protein
MMGVDNKKENRAAVSRVMLGKSPALIVIPEQETPGKRAMACAVPM